MPSLVELAENANTYTPLGPTDERVVDDRYVLWMGRGDEPGWNVAQRFRFKPDELTEIREEIHAHLRAKGRTACTWEIGTHATPEDLVDRLLELGLVDDEPTPLAVGMVLTEAPAQAPPDVEVRRATTGAEHFASARIAAVAFGGPIPTEVPADHEPDPDNVVYLAYVDGEPVARASASCFEHAVALFGGSTLPAGARSRRLPGARRCSLGGRRGARNADARDPGISDVAADSAPTWLSRAVRDPHPARRVRQARMRVSAKADYAIRATIELAAAAEGPTKGDRIAQAQAIPLNFLENILVDLRNAGLVASRRGAEGGYWLARPAAEISLADVIRAVDGPLANVRGVRSEQLDYTGSAEPLRDVWVAVRASLRAVLESVTLADLAAGELPENVRALAADPDAWASH